MANEYSDIATLKKVLGITSDTSRDDLLTAALAAASRSVDQYTGRRFYADGVATARVYRSFRRVVPEPDGDRILIDDVSSTTGLVVEVGSAGSTSYSTTTQYEVQPDNALARGFPITSLLAVSNGWGYGTTARVRVTAKWGWPAVPDEVTSATLIQASRLFKRRESPEGVIGSAEWGTIRLSRVDPDVQALLRPYVLPGIG